MSRTVLLIAAGLAVAVGIAYAAADRGDAAGGAAAAPAEVEPGADNVDPSVHAQFERLRQAAEAAPDDVAAQLAFADFAAGAHRRAETVGALERAVEAAPERRQPWLDLAHAHGAAGAWDAVVDVSERMLARFPGDADARYNLGAAHANAGRTAAAREVWTALASEPGALAAQAQTSLDQLATMPVTAPAAGAAPPLAEGQTALPPGHPPLGAAPSREPSYVVPGGTVTAGEAERTRALLTEMQTLE